MGAMSTFSVEMGNHPHSAQDTPNITPTDTPKNTYARVSSPNGPAAHLHNPAPQAVYPHRVRSGQSGSPPREPLPAPMWTAVNPGPGQPQSQPPAPPPANYVPGPPPLPPPPLQPRTNYAPTPQATRPAPTPVGPPPVGPPSVPSSLAPRPPYSPGRDMANHLQARLTSALEKQTRGVDELRQVQNEIHGLLNERHSAEQRRMEEHQAMMIEKNNLRDENGRLRSWGEDLQRGNLELQEFERRYQTSAKDISELREHNQYLRDNAALAERKIKDLESQLENIRKSGHNNVTTNGSLTSVKDMDELVQSHFSTSAKHAAKLSLLVDDVESANSKDLSGRISTLKAYLGQVNEQRDIQKNEWKAVFSRIASSDGRAKEYGGGKVNGARKGLP
jgi:predicted RNase H-like nuclease (RuvC/YqgF family)